MKKIRLVVCGLLIMFGFLFMVFLPSAAARQSQGTVAEVETFHCLNDTTCFYGFSFNPVTGKYSFSDPVEILKAGTATITTVGTKTIYTDTTDETYLKVVIAANGAGALVYHDPAHSLVINYANIVSNDCSCE